METFGDLTIAGAAHTGSDFDEAELWADLDDYMDDLDETLVGEERYGVYYDIADSGEFTYVAGVEVDSTNDIPPELTVVDIPETTYAVFSTTGEAVEDVTFAIDEGEFGDVDHDEDVGLLFERYDPNVTPTDLETDLEFYVPVEEE